ncbi:hypothetical protein BESB_003680 [Besnoitia besnoiti]|uniref:Uncharacterized protein n=1 Tax=Besnoitia besnoiti TaxID=94643 RepID=A0A2A9MPN3_BESBE|nr:hypothetical protein BESB_003680 [Besnoitia besnoiti]PFH38027.1 hypothetical protein BESB_003680 [Besnoitia besnoiti]
MRCSLAAQELAPFLRSRPSGRIPAFFLKKFTSSGEGACSLLALNAQCRPASSKFFPPKSPRGFEHCGLQGSPSPDLLLPHCLATPYPLRRLSSSPHSASLSESPSPSAPAPSLASAASPSRALASKCIKTRADDSWPASPAAASASSCAERVELPGEEAKDDVLGAPPEFTSVLDGSPEGKPREAGISCLKARCRTRAVTCEGETAGSLSADAAAAAPPRGGATTSPFFFRVAAENETAQAWRDKEVRTAGELSLASRSAGLAESRLLPSEVSASAAASRSWGPVAGRERGLSQLVDCEAALAFAALPQIRCHSVLEGACPGLLSQVPRERASLRANREGLTPSERDRRDRKERRAAELQEGGAECSRALPMPSHAGRREEETGLHLPGQERDFDGYYCWNRNPSARYPKKGNKGCRPVCRAMRKIRKRLKTGR